MRYSKIMLTGILLGTTLLTAKAGTTAPSSEFSAFYSPVRASMVMQTDTSGDKVEAFKKEWSKKMDKVDKKIDKAEKKLDNAKDQGRENLNKKIDDLKDQRKKLQDDIDSAGDNAGDQWNEFKDKVDEEYSTLNQKVKDFFRSKD